tara:strand:- start:2438 stop:2617 length:180 start_codon:yes stop_codon:yes gene_type:complete
MTLRSKILKAIDEAIELSANAGQNIQARGAIIKLVGARAAIASAIEEEETEEEETEDTE